MQVILLEKITHLGELGAVVKVKDGYADTAADLLRERYQQVLDYSKMYNMNVPMVAGVDGRLFGSVTNADIAEAVDKLGFQIKKSQVRTPLGAIKAVGDFTITIGLMTDITADVTVQVVAEE